MEVSYFPEGGSITDYVCEMFDTKVGVSVTRAMKYRGDFEDEDAEHLLNKKLRGKIYIFFEHVEMFLSSIKKLYDDAFDVRGVGISVSDVMDKLLAVTQTVLCANNYCSVVFLSLQRAFQPPDVLTLVCTKLLLKI